MKEAAYHQVETVEDATITLREGVKRCVRSYSKEAGREIRQQSKIMYNIVTDIKERIHYTHHTSVIRRF